jgi:hypothetical protein
LSIEPNKCVSRPLNFRFYGREQAIIQKKKKNVWSKITTGFMSFSGVPFKRRKARWDRKRKGKFRFISLNVSLLSLMGPIFPVVSLPV